MAVAERRFRVMASDTQVLVLDGPADLSSVAERALAQLEQAWSRFLPTSDISRLNGAGGAPTQVQEVTVTLIETMIQAVRDTQSRYDPTLLPFLLAAGYRSSIDNPARRTELPGPFAPTAQDVTEIGIDPANRTVTLPRGLALDAGGIGKGLAADLVVAELLTRGAAGALVSVGGDLAAAGLAPTITSDIGDSATDYPVSGWSIDIENALDPTAVWQRLTIAGGGVATSSTRTRRWCADAEVRHHVIDPATQRQSDTDLVAVTVVASCGWMAEAHATSLLVGGATSFHPLARAAGVEAVATLADGSTLTTPGLTPTTNEVATQ